MPFDLGPHPDDRISQAELTDRSPIGVVIGYMGRPTIIEVKERSMRRWTANLHGGARTRARNDNVPFDLDPEWIWDKLVAGHCEMTGLHFEFIGSKRGYFGPSLDRRVGRFGYTKANTRVVVWGYNAAKMTGTDADVLRMAEALVLQKALKDGGASGP